MTINNTTSSTTTTTTTTTTVDDFQEAIIPNEFQIVEIVILSLMLLACLFGNLLVLAVIIGTKKFRTSANYLIINLAVCDMAFAVLAIPFTLIIYNIIYSHQSYPYGYIGCKLLWPITTYANNGSVFTLVTIAIERYVHTSSIRHKLTKKRIGYVISLVHILAFVTVIPYISHLRYGIVKGNPQCFEKWDSHWHQKYYTIALVNVQYVFPLLIMIVFYSLTWRKLYTRNKEMIKMSEDYESKMTWRIQNKRHSLKHTNAEELLSNIDEKDESKLCLLKSVERESIPNKHNEPLENSCGKVNMGRRGTLERIMQSRFNFKEPKSNVKPNKRPVSAPSLARRFSKDKLMSSNQQVKRGDSNGSINMRTHSTGSISSKDLKRFRRSAYKSETAYIRHRQSIRTLKMFTTVVFIFAIFALPNQISWVLQDFARFPLIILDIFIILTYVSSVVNCWIYGGFNKGIRKEYIRILQLPCRQCTNKPKERKESETIYLGSFYDSRLENIYLRRQSAFSRMFKDHIENFDNFKHLYEKDDQVSML